MKSRVILRQAIGVVGVLMIASCSDAADSGPRERFAVRDSAGIEIAENGGDPGSLDWTVVPTPSVVIGGNDPEQQLYRVSGAIRLSDGTIVIGNLGTSELMAFSGAGELVWRAGGAGEGPGDFSALSRVMHAGGDSIAVGDPRLARVSVFDPTGRFAYSVSHASAPFTSASSRFENGDFLAQTSGWPMARTGESRVERQPISVHRVTLDGVPEQLAVVPGLEVDVGVTGGATPEGEPVMGINPRPFAPNGYVVGDADGWAVADGAKAEIRLLDPDGDTVRLIRWESEPPAVTPEQVESFYEVSLSSVTDDARRNRLMEAHADRPPPPESMPHFGLPWRGPYVGGALMDDAGRIWLKQFIRPWEEEPNQYMVFDRTGRWLGTVDVPIGLSVLAVGDAYVIGRRIDALEVETVEVYELLKDD